MTGHEGIARLSVEDYATKKIGRQVYTHRLDPSKFRKDRDFEVEWVDGPVRFSVSRDDHNDYWLFKAAPAGKAGTICTGYEEDRLGSSRGGGNGTTRTTISPAREGYQESFGVGDVVYTKTTIDLKANPFEIRRGYTSEPDGHLGFIKTLSFTIDTPEHDDHRVSTEMVKAQVKTLARHYVTWGKHMLRGGRLKDAVSDASRVRKNRVLNPLRDTAYVLNLREETAYATARRAQGYTHIPPNMGDGADEKLHPWAKRVGRLAWRAGLRDKPEYVEWEERLERRREEEREAYAQQARDHQSRPPEPPRKPSKKDNTCPKCGGRYHKKDLSTESVEGKMMTGTNWLCPDCGGIVGAESDYHGPVPVKTHYGTELH